MDIYSLHKASCPKHFTSNEKKMQNKKYHSISFIINYVTLFLFHLRKYPEFSVDIWKSIGFAV